jgi:hypothetical protein
MLRLLRVYLHRYRLLVAEKTHGLAAAGSFFPRSRRSNLIIRVEKILLVHALPTQQLVLSRANF